MSRAVRVLLGAVPIVVVLSTITWVILYYAFPDAPLKAEETALIVFIFTIPTLAFQGFLRRQKSSVKDKKNEPTR